MSTETTDKWAKPQELDDVSVVFPANPPMPTREECKEGLDQLSDKDRQKWLSFQDAWFFHGLPEDTEFQMRDDIDGKAAIRHLSAIQGSFAPKHEHKMEAVAYLASRWIKKVKPEPEVKPYL